MPMLYNHSMANQPSNPAADDLDPAMVESLRHKTPLEKLAMVDAMWRSARNQILLVLRAQHPDWTEARIQHEASDRISQGAVRAALTLRRQTDADHGIACSGTMPFTMSCMRSPTVQSGMSNSRTPS